jgi:hypothetical protein
VGGQTRVPVGPEEEEIFYELLGEGYVHGMMDGEAIVFQAVNPQLLTTSPFIYTPNSSSSPSTPQKQPAISATSVFQQPCTQSSSSELLEIEKGSVSSREWASGRLLRRDCLGVGRRKR